MTHSLRIFFDGGCKGKNLKGGTTIAIGVHVMFNDTRMHCHEVSEILAVWGSNNMAEWNGIVRSLEIALRYKQWAVKRNEQLKINIFGDARIPIEQLNGICKIKQHNFRPYADKSKHLVNQIGKVLYGVHWIPREQNKEADKLAGLAFK